KRRDLPDVLHPTHRAGKAHSREAAEALDNLTDVLTAVADVETEHRRLLDLVVVPLVALAVTLQYVQLVRDLRRRKEIARIRIFGDEAKGLLLAHAADHDRRMRPREALGRAQRALERELFALETRLVALPHLQAQAEGVLEPLEPLGDGLKRDAEALRLVFVPPRTDAEHPAAPGQHVQCRDDLRDDARVPVDGARDDRHEPRTGRVRGAAFRNRRVVHVSSIFANPTGRYPFSPVISPSTSRCFHHGVAGRSVTALVLPPLG